MAVRITFETHSTTTDNEAGIATGWLPGTLSDLGREQARLLGERRAEHVDAVFTSDLARAAETASLAFRATSIPVLHDWRLRECDYGRLNGAPRAAVLGRRREHLVVPYPGGESWQQAVDRVGRFLDDLHLRWDGCHVVVIGHVATKWGLEHHLCGRPLDDLAAHEFIWQEGWEYRM
jgi:broad specificity phosphatase PhoE